MHSRLSELTLLCSNPVSATKKSGLPIRVKPFLIFSNYLKNKDLFFICSLFILKNTKRYNQIQENRRRKAIIAFEFFGL
jgi:hypothetical protein